MDIILLGQFLGVVASVLTILSILLAVAFRRSPSEDAPPSDSRPRLSLRLPRLRRSRAPLYVEEMQEKNRGGLR